MRRPTPLRWAVIALVGLMLAWWCSRFFETPNHQRISFYGMVVDQNGQPVPGATVYITVLYNSLLGSGEDRAVLQTNENGAFSVTGYRGRTLDIGLRKDGYDYEGDVGPFHYTTLVPETQRHHPDKDQPVKFGMWKRKGAETMVKYQAIEFPLKFDGTEYRVDLLKGMVVKEGGDLFFRLTSPQALTGQSNSSGRWTWGLEMEAVGGGFVLSHQKLMSEAPESGYQPKLELGKQATANDWDGQARGDFYSFTRQKFYSKFHLYFTGNPAIFQGVLTISSQTNPSGSRNLEYDLAKDVTDHYREKE
jgi:hypothetical protein